MKTNDLVAATGAILSRDNMSVDIRKHLDALVATAVLIERERIKTLLLKRGPFPRPYVQELIEAIDEGNK